MSATCTPTIREVGDGYVVECPRHRDFVIACRSRHAAERIVELHCTGTEATP